jgi:hypothetical protein
VVPLPFERLTRAEWYPGESAKMVEWQDYKKQLSEEYLLVVGAEQIWTSFLKEDTYQNDINLLNKAYGTHYNKIADDGCNTRS